MRQGIFIVIVASFLGILDAQEGLDSVERRAREKAELQRWSGKLYRLFRRADSNRDKTLSLLELRNHMQAKMKDRSTSENDLLLRILRKKNPKLDIDRDGLLTKSEVVSYLDQFISEEERQRAENQTSFPKSP